MTTALVFFFAAGIVAAGWIGFVVGLRHGRQDRSRDRLAATLESLDRDLRQSVTADFEAWKNTP